MGSEVQWNVGQYSANINSCRSHARDLPNWPETLFPTQSKWPPSMKVINLANFKPLNDDVLLCIVPVGDKKLSGNADVLPAPLGAETSVDKASDGR